LLRADNTTSKPQATKHAAENAILRYRRARIIDRHYSGLATVRMV
jgi:hypothetical protein